MQLFEELHCRKKLQTGKEITLTRQTRIQISFLEYGFTKQALDWISKLRLRAKRKEFGCFLGPIKVS